MNLQQLEYALHLRQMGSYSRAAKVCGISQPALSIQIRKLEDELGFALFDRSQRKIRPTAEGEIFLERAQLLITESNQLRELGRKLNREYSGSLNIGIIPTLAPYLLPLFIQQYRGQYPATRLNIVEALTEEIVHGLRTGNLDGGIIATPFNSRIKFTVNPLFYESFLLFVSPEHSLYSRQKIPISDIPMGDIWLLKEGNCFRDQVNNICEIASAKDDPDIKLHFESNSIESLCRIVEYQGGITFLPELTTLSFSSEREEMIKEIKGEKRIREISMIHLPAHIRTDQMQDLSAVIRKCVPKKMHNRGHRDPVPTNLQL